MLTKRQSNELKKLHVEIVVEADDRYKRKLIVFVVNGERRRVDWVLWKCAVVKGGKAKRLRLDEEHRGQFWKLLHRSSCGKGDWHSQRERGSIEELVSYAVKHDFLRDEPC